MLKRLDIFVFWTIIIIVPFVLIITVIGALLGCRIRPEIVLPLTYSFYIIILFRFFNDNYFKLKYFLGYVFSSFIIDRILGIFVKKISFSLFSSYIFSYIIIVVGMALLHSFLFQLFKEISYKRNIKSL
ncbi:hypothetical protein [Fusobacterium sp.]|uniref:hypothetical protein n=1 Tax=Fusobacterium sp. TaxID=68766 RepID=UPI00290413E1|nr:hypothetical protein [Fusobacterium sp.]MDU1911757.1 hypothetical protein [Fusobacterium sp.]